MEKEIWKLADINTTLQVIIELKNKEIKNISDSFSKNVKEIILPNLNILRGCKSEEKRNTIIDLIENQLMKMIRTPGVRLSAKTPELTQTEVKVASLVMQGLSSKEIAFVLGVSSKTIKNHRARIRKKLGVSDSRMSLKSFLDLLENDT